MNKYGFLILLAFSPMAFPQADDVDPHAAHGSHGAQGGGQHLTTPGMHAAPEANQTLPIEGGQSAFAALIEITALLEADDQTDWASVDLDGLRSHLLDMDQLMLSTQAVTEVIDSSTVRFTISGPKEAIPAIHRMVPAHARFIGQSRGWDIKPTLVDTGATVSISADSPTLVTRLKGLGFYGFMSLDSHHQAHHLQIAMGKSH